jgi:hypothetical protein
MEQLASSKMLFFGSLQRRLRALALLVVIFIADLIPGALAQTYKCQFLSDQFANGKMNLRCSQSRQN